MLFTQNFGAFFVIFDLLILVMLAAIQFNSQFGFMTVEIKDESANWVLSTEFGIMKGTIAEN